MHAERPKRQRINDVHECRFLCECHDLRFEQEAIGCAFPTKRTPAEGPRGSTYLLDSSAPAMDAARQSAPVRCKSQICRCRRLRSHAMQSFHSLCKLLQTQARQEWRIEKNIFRQAFRNGDKIATALAWCQLRPRLNEPGSTPCGLCRTGCPSRGLLSLLLLIPTTRRSPLGG